MIGFNYRPNGSPRHQPPANGQSWDGNGGPQYEQQQRQAGRRYNLNTSLMGFRSLQISNLVTSLKTSYCISLWRILVVAYRICLPLQTLIYNLCCWLLLTERCPRLCQFDMGDADYHAGLCISSSGSSSGASMLFLLSSAIGSIQIYVYN